MIKKTTKSRPMGNHGKLDPLRSGQGAANNVHGLGANLPKSPSWSWEIRIDLVKRVGLSNRVGLNLVKLNVKIKDLGLSGPLNGLARSFLELVGPLG